MRRIGFVYVGIPSKKNLNIGIANGVWGWRSTTLDKADGRAKVKQLGVGDTLVFAYHGPNPRVAKEEWKDASVRRIVIAEVTRTHYRDTSPIWPDATYEDRIGFSMEADQSGPFRLGTLSADSPECLWSSANKQGSLVLSTELTPLEEAVVDELGTVDDPAPLAFEGSLSTLRYMAQRREQGELRARLFSGKETAVCALCGRTLPRGLLRVAHIKRRSEASHQERLDLNNVMPACTLGCDDLFEQGFIHVDVTGRIRAVPRPGATPHLERAIATLSGREVRDYKAARAVYFAYHRERGKGATRDTPAPAPSPENVTLR